MLDNQELRTQMRNKRNQLPIAAVHVASNKIFQRLVKLSEFVTAKSIAIYFATEGEITTERIAKYCWEQGKNCFLPKLDRTQKNLYFYSYDHNDTLIVNKFGIAEPDPTKKILTPLTSLDLICLPLVAFDSQRNRLGRGAGYYDRSLEPVRTSSKPQLIGLGYAFQQVAQLTPQSWDIPMDKIISENHVY